MKYHRLSLQSERGAALVEVIISLLLVTLVLGFIGTTISTYISARDTLLRSAQQAYVAEETYEAVRFLRDGNWDAVATIPLDTPHYLTVATTTISLEPTPAPGTTVLREVWFDEVYRTSGGAITASTTAGASVDTNARLVRVIVGDGVASTTVEGIITNLFEI